MNLHHIAGDGWSTDVLVREWMALYQAALDQSAVGGETVDQALPPLPLQYLDFAVWQRDWLRGEALPHAVR